MAADYDPSAGGMNFPPELMNSKNKEMYDKIQEYTAEQHRKQGELDDNSSRVQMMEDHLKNVKQEIGSTQGQQAAKRGELDTESHMVQLVERVIGRYKQDIDKFKTMEFDLQGKLEGVQNAIFHGNMRMDTHKRNLNLQKDSLDQWDEARRQKEEDVEALGRYSKADQAKMRALLLDQQNLQKTLNQKKKDLEVEITETKVAQIELDKTAADLQRVHGERADLITQWDEAIRAIGKRDEAIKEHGRRFAEGKRWHDRQERALKEREQQLANEVGNNKELDNKIAQEERVLGKYRHDHIQLAKHLVEMEDELEVMKNVLSKATSDLKRTELAVIGKQGELEQKKVEVEKRKQQLEEAKARLSDEIAATGTLEQQNALVGGMLTEMEKAKKEFEQEMEQLKNAQFSRSEELYELRRQESNHLAFISGAQTQRRNLLARIAQLDSETFTQQELLYNIEFQVQQMERKVNRARGDRTEDEKKDLKEKVELLQSMLGDLTKQHKVLDQQLKLVVDDLRKTKLLVGKQDKEKAKANEYILELELETASWATELEKLAASRKGLLVDQDVLKLQVNKLAKQLDEKDQELHGLENRREQLRLLLEEKEVLTQEDHDILRYELRLVLEERKKVATDLRAKEMQVMHLKTRYNVMNDRMKRPEGEEEGLTHAQRMIKVAKEREELQAQGDALDKSVKKQQKTLAKLDEAIARVTSYNSASKNSLKTCKPGDPSLQEQQAVKKQIAALQQQNHRRQVEIKQQMSTELAKLQDLQQVQQDKEEAQRQLSELQKEHNSLLGQVEEEESKRNRFQHDLNLMLQTQGEPERLLIHNQVQEDLLKSGIHLLVGIGEESRNADLSNRITDLVHSHNLAAVTQGPLR